MVQLSLQLGCHPLSYTPGLVLLSCKLCSWSLILRIPTVHDPSFITCYQWVEYWKDGSHMPTLHPNHVDKVDQHWSGTFKRSCWWAILTMQSKNYCSFTTQGLLYVLLRVGPQLENWVCVGKKSTTNTHTHILVGCLLDDASLTVTLMWGPLLCHLWLFPRAHLRWMISFLRPATDFEPVQASPIWLLILQD